MTQSKWSRRRFLQAAGVAGVAVPAAIVGVNLYGAQGESPTVVSPYAQDHALAQGAATAPILFLTAQTDDNVFARYLAEILSAEGLNAFQVAPVSALSPDLLAVVDLIVLAEGTLNTTQVDILETFVRTGGQLVAMRPQAWTRGAVGRRARRWIDRRGRLDRRSRSPVRRWHHA